VRRELGKDYSLLGGFSKHNPGGGGSHKKKGTKGFQNTYFSPPGGPR